MLKEFNAKNEEDLLRKLNNDCQTLPCIVCGKEIPIDKVHFQDGDPYCKNHVGQAYEYQE